MNKKAKDLSILVTGANGGIGTETVKALITQGVKRIALACRSLDKAERMKRSLKPGKTELIPLGGFDMLKPEAIRKAVEEIPTNAPYDVIFLQAGGMVTGNNFQFVKEGSVPFEKTIYQNVIGAFKTLQALQKHDLVATNARIVFAGGEGARGIKGFINQPRFSSNEDLLKYIREGRGEYKDIDALGVSKFMSALLVQKLAEQNTGNSFIWFSPGLTMGTNGLSGFSQPKRFIMEKLIFPIMWLAGLAQKPKEAGKKNMKCLIGEIGENGDILGAPEGKTLGKLVDQKPMNEALTNHQFRDLFWKELTTNNVYHTKNLEYDYR